MFDALRKFVLSLAATLVGAGNAACACPSFAAPTSERTHVACADSQPANSAHGAHGMHQIAMHHGAGAPASPIDSGEKSPPPDHSQCGHCNLAAVGASSAVDDGVVAAFAKIYKATATATANALPDFARGEVAPEGRGRWRAPPTATPVALKIRLRQ